MAPIETLLQRIRADPGLLETSFTVAKAREFQLWVTKLNLTEAVNFNIAQAAQAYDEFVIGYKAHGKSRLVLAYDGGQDVSYVLVLDRVRRAEVLSRDSSSSNSSITIAVGTPPETDATNQHTKAWKRSSRMWPGLPWSPGFSDNTDYHCLDSTALSTTSQQQQQPLRQRFSQWVLKHQTITLVILGLPLLLVLLVSVFSASEKTKWPSDGWIKYRTPSSEGPRRQLRIFYHNASAWSRNNPHDHGEWRIRLDDQALIPAELYDEDEDRYQ